MPQSVAARFGFELAAERTCGRRGPCPPLVGMVAVIVTFRYGAEFEAAKVRKLAEGARPLFEGMPGLRSKVFTLNAEAREATNFYVWDDETAAKQFFDDEMLARVTGLYGVRPSVSFVEIAALVDNAHAH
jgi:heme-degrading monooxygenase HmoA